MDVPGGNEDLVEDQRSMHDQSVHLDFADFVVPEIEVTNLDWHKLRLKTDVRNPARLTDPVRNELDEGELMINVSLGGWFILACLQHFTDIELSGYEFSVRGYDSDIHLTVPITIILGEKVISPHGPLEDVDPAKYRCAADILSNPFGSPLDWNVLIRLGMQELLNRFNEVFEVFDSPESVRFVSEYAERFPSAVMDRERKILTVSRAELEAFPNHSLVHWNDVMNNRVGMGWTVEFVD